MSDMRHEACHIREFEKHGWVLIRNLLQPEEIEAAYPGLFSIYPTPEAFHAGDADFRPEGHLAIADRADNKGSDPRFRPMQFAGLKEFPFHDQTLNLLALHPAIIAVAESLLKSRDVRLYQAETFAKYSGVVQYDQPFHVDYKNHVMLPPKRGGRYGQIQMFLFLSDVAEDDGPTRIVSRTLTDDVPLIELTERGAMTGSQQVADWERSATNALGPRGSLLVYSSDILHRGTDMRRPNGSRFYFNLGYRVAGADWVGSNPWPRKTFYPAWDPLVSHCSVRQLEVLGFPPPGHDYWDPDTVRACAERYPELDLTPWRMALTTGADGSVHSPVEALATDASAACA